MQRGGGGGGGGGKGALAKSDLERQTGGNNTKKNFGYEVVKKATDSGTSTARIIFNADRVPLNKVVKEN